jgi:hypothetical protein
MHFEHQYAGKPAQPINVGEPPLLWRCSHAVEPHQNRTRNATPECKRGLSYRSGSYDTTIGATQGKSLGFLSSC